MPDLIHKPIRDRLVPVCLLLIFGFALFGCAHEQTPQLVNDPSAPKHDSAIPWNEQTDWERAGPYGEALNRKNQGL